MPDRYNPLTRLLEDDNARPHRFPTHEGQLTHEELIEHMQHGSFPVQYHVPEMSQASMRPIRMDIEGQRDAIEQWAEARISAARRGAEVSSTMADAATRRMLVNALGMGGMQAITGVRQPVAHQAYAQQAGAAMDRAFGAEAEAVQTEEMAGAHAARDISQLEAQANIHNQEQARQAAQMRDDLANRRGAARTRASQRSADLTRDELLRLHQERREDERFTQQQQVRQQQQGRQTQNYWRRAEGAISDMNQTVESALELSKLREDFRTTVNEEDRKKILNELSQWGVNVDPGMFEFNEAHNQRVVEQVNDYLDDMQGMMNRYAERYNNFADRLTPEQQAQLEASMGGRPPVILREAMRDYRRGAQGGEGQGGGAQGGGGEDIDLRDPPPADPAVDPTADPEVVEPEEEEDSVASELHQMYNYIEWIKENAPALYDDNAKAAERLLLQYRPIQGGDTGPWNMHDNAQRIYDAITGKDQGAGFTPARMRAHKEKAAAFHEEWLKRRGAVRGGNQGHSPQGLDSERGIFDGIVQ